MPQLDPYIICQSSVSLLLFFWICVFLFIYILTPLIKLRFVLIDEKDVLQNLKEDSLPFYGKTSKFNDILS